MGRRNMRDLAIDQDLLTFKSESTEKLISMEFSTMHLDVVIENFAQFLQASGYPEGAIKRAFEQYAE